MPLTQRRGSVHEESQHVVKQEIQHVSNVSNASGKDNSLDLDDFLNPMKDPSEAPVSVKLS